MSVYPVNPTPFHGVPKGLFEQLLEWLSLSGMNAMRKVDKTFLQRLNSSIPIAYKNGLISRHSEINPIKYNLERQILNTLKIQLSAFSACTHLDLSTKTADQSLSEILAQFPNLRSLGLSGRRDLTDLSCLAGLPLERLNLAGVQITDATLATLPAGLPLKHVNLARAKITDAGLAILSKYPTLEHLNLHDCQTFSDIGIRSLKELPNLRYLDCFLCKQLTDQSLETLAQFPSLLYLGIGNGNITNLGLSYLSTTQLLSLDLTNCTQIQDVGLAYLKALKKAQHIILCSCPNISNEGVTDLAMLSSLKKIAVTYCYKVNENSKYHLRTRGLLDESYKTLPWGNTNSSMGRLFI